jgi:rsbT co-antagonist protein RsbR
MDMLQEEEAWKGLAELLRSHADVIVEHLIAEALEVTKNGYGPSLSEHSRLIATVGVKAILADIEEVNPHHLGDLLAGVAEQRVRQGLQLHDAQRMLRVLDRVLRDLCCDGYPDPKERLMAIERCHAVVSAAREAAFEGFVRATATVLGEQLEIVKQLSAPILPIYAGVLLLPLVGLIDAQRAEQIMESLLSAIERVRASVVIMDITGVPAIDASVAGFLTQASRAAGLLGARVVFVGIGPAIAQTMVAGAFDLGSAITLANLQAGLDYALSQRGLFIQGRKGASAW